MSGRFASYTSDPPLRSLAALVAAGLFAAAAMPASAQTTAQATAQVTILEPLSLVNTADMNFGRISNVSGGGTVVMAATASPGCTTTGGLIHSSVCQPAVFQGLGMPGRNVRLKKVSGNTITLTGPSSATMTISGVNLGTAPDLTYLSGNPNSNGFVRYRIDSGSGAFAFRVGGTLNVNAGQAAGVYTGTFAVELNYD